MLVLTQLLVFVLVILFFYHQGHGTPDQHQRQLLLYLKRTTIKATTLNSTIHVALSPSSPPGPLSMPISPQISHLRRFMVVLILLLGALHHSELSPQTSTLNPKPLKP